MLRDKPYIAFTASCLVALTFSFLGAVQLSYFAPGAAARSAGAPQTMSDPIAVVKSILVDGTEKLEAAQSEVTVTHVDSKEEGGKAGLLLTAGDEVITGPNAQVTILFLDAAPEKDNEVLVDSNARIRIGSIFDLLGRVLIRVKGKFDTATEKVKFDVNGAEYELVVQADGTNRIRVLDGAVGLETVGFFTSSIGASGPVPKPSVADDAAEVVRSFEIAGSPQKRMEFVAVRGQTTSLEHKFIFTNRCSRKHQFEIRGPRNLEWFQLVGADKFDIGPGLSSTISFALKADATRMSVGVYEGEIIARCLDCTQERRCGMAGFLLPISVNVIADRTGGPSVPRGSPGRVEQRTTVAQKLQEVTLTTDRKLVQNSASTDQVDETLNWSNTVILAGQPTYSAQSIVPHFRSGDDRKRLFREARRGAILTDDQRSYQTLGNIYVDWGNGARAVDELRKAESAVRPSPQRLASLGDAYRLTGKLPEAENTLLQTVQQYPRYAPGLNALGNVYLDRAKIAQDKRDYEGAKADLERAKDYYSRALEIQSPQRRPAPSPRANVPVSNQEEHHTLARKSAGQWRIAAESRPPRALPEQRAAQANDIVRVVSESNLGEVNQALGDIAREQGRIGEASTQYSAAEQAFSQAEKMSGSYAFATKGLGDVYRGMRNVAVIQGNSAAASKAFALSQQKYSQALKIHNDLAEAYVGLGNLYEDDGRSDEAVKAYRQATRVRPEAPKAYYHLAVALARSDQRLAAFYARAFLKLEREDFKQGEKASNATRVIEDRRPLPTPTIWSQSATQSPTPTPTATTTPTPTPTPTPPLIQVPHVNGDRPDDALKKLRRIGLDGQIREQADCNANGKVLGTSPERDKRVPRGTMVTVFISAAGENAATVPSLTSRPLNEVEQELKSLGWRADVRKRENNSVAENTVLGQKPQANSRLKSGCSVELTVSTRVKQIAVPSYIGLSREEAYKRLPRFSLSLIRGSVTEIDSDKPPGTVVDQNPKAGEMVNPGMLVNLVIARGVQVPDLRGMTEKEARAYIQGTQGRFRPGQVTEKKIANVKLNTVIDQYPLPNQTVPVGTAINLVISKAPAPTPTPTPVIY